LFNKVFHASMQKEWFSWRKPEGMGGTITVESMVDVGTKFEIIFKKLQYG
jgi:hypothetical protein